MIRLRKHPDAPPPHDFDTARYVKGVVQEYERHPLQPATAGWLDYRSYTVFEYRGTRLLYDLNTGCVLTLDARAFAILSLAKAHSLGELKEMFPTEADLKAFEEIDILRESGLFQFEGQPSVAEAERYFLDLYNHSPRRIQLFVAQACNLACKYCYAEEQGSNARNKLMSFEVAKASVDYLMKMSRSRPNLSIQFFGGEALLGFGLIKQVVEYCEQLSAESGKTFNYQISTNGVLLTEEARSFLVKHKFASLVSVDGDRDAHDANRVMRGGGGSYDRVVDNALALQAAYAADAQPVEQLKIRATLSRQNPSTLRAAEALRAAGFLHVGIGAAKLAPDSRFAKLHLEEVKKRIKKAKAPEVVIGPQLPPQPERKKP